MPAKQPFNTHSKVLLDAGVDATEAEEGSYPPLITAISCGHVDAARLLLQRGAAAEGAGPWGYSALELAVHGKLSC